MKKLILVLAIMLCTVGAYAEREIINNECRRDYIETPFGGGPYFMCNPPSASNVIRHTMYVDRDFERLDIDEFYNDGTYKTTSFHNQLDDTYCTIRVQKRDSYGIAHVIEAQHEVSCAMMHSAYQGFLNLYGL